MSKTPEQRAKEFIEEHFETEGGVAVCITTTPRLVKYLADEFREVEEEAAGAKKRSD